MSNGFLMGGLRSSSRAQLERRHLLARRYRIGIRQLWLAGWWQEDMSLREAQEIKMQSDRVIERGMRLAAGLPDVMPDQADARIQPIYEDIQQSLRVPFVNLIFRTLANDPDYLEAAWRRLRPMVRQLAFEQAADEVRSVALVKPAPARLKAELEKIDDLDRLRAFNDTIHYVLPKLLLIVTALQASMTAGTTSGADQHTFDRDSAEIPLGVSEGTAKVEMLDPKQSGSRLEDLFERIKKRHGHTLVSSYYRGLGNWPDLLDSAWSRIEPLVGTDPYKERSHALVERAEECMRSLPNIISHEMGAKDKTNDEISAILAAFRLKFIPEMLIDVTLVKAMLDGPEAATVSRFSAAK